MTETSSETTGTLATALSHAAGLLDSQPELALQQAEEILRVMPQQPQARLLQVAALRRMGRADAALTVLEPLIRALPDWPQVHLEAGLALGDLGLGRAAIAALRRSLELEPRLAAAWAALTDQLMLAGDEKAAEAAQAQQIRASVRDPELIAAASSLCDNDLAIAERRLKAYLSRQPANVSAIRMLAEVAARLGRNEDARRLLERSLDLAPAFAEARSNLATILYRLNLSEESLGHLKWLMDRDPRHPGYRNLKAAALGRVGDYEGAIALYQGVLAEFPDQPRAWMSLGHALKTVGRQADSIAAYRRCLALAPAMGEAWWSLANLKTFQFTDEDLAEIRRQLEGHGLTDEDRFHFDYALGKALEDRQAFEESFAHYSRGAARRRQSVDYSADRTHQHVQRSTALFTRDFLAARRGWGAADRDPIFVVGLPRSGSTLIEQILASHSAVEGTMELPDIISIARRLGAEAPEGEGYVRALSGLTPGDCEALGQEYLQRTRIQRKTDRPFFIDKMPNNFAHLGLIRLILPGATIIDARRHPLGCCFSAFKQHFARGQGFSYDLDDLGRYYRDYVDLMAHFDAVDPGAVHRILYEQMVADPEARIRGLLDHCGLDFEPGCLSFHENTRAVRTASSEQVRRPIFTDGVEQWRAYEPWLGPLKAALGPALEGWDRAIEPV
jgi:tetratricopeptide (TPR) repeat protein